MSFCHFPNGVNKKLCVKTGIVLKCKTEDFFNLKNSISKLLLLWVIKNAGRIMGFHYERTMVDVTEKMFTVHEVLMKRSSLKITQLL